jgi:hypothetical protein
LLYSSNLTNVIDERDVQCCSFPLTHMPLYDCCRPMDVTSATKSHGAQRGPLLTCWRGPVCPHTLEASGLARAARPAPWDSSSPVGCASTSATGHGTGSTVSTRTLPAPCRPSPPQRLDATPVASPLPAKWKEASSSTSGWSTPPLQFLIEGWPRIFKEIVGVFPGESGRSACPGT